MNKIFTILFYVSLISIGACNSGNPPIQHENHEEQAHWSYSGETSPEHWVEIERNSECGGMHQSPINIIEIDAVPTDNPDNLKVFYSPETFLHDVTNNGHSIQFDFDTGDSIQYNETIFFLRQIHFHVPAEHYINGVKYPIEIHLVHMSNKNELAVCGILGMEGKESQLFEFFKSFLPIANGEVKEISKVIDLTNLDLENKDYYSYSGSLTTPPCTENVNWIVFKEPLILSQKEVLALKNNMPINNYRNEQELNDRIVYYKHSGE